MDKDTFKKYLLLKDDRSIYKTIWMIKNNDKRNKYIHKLLETVLSKVNILTEYRESLITGMPKVNYESFMTVYFNYYTYSFIIIIKNFKNGLYNSNKNYHIRNIINIPVELYGKSSIILLLTKKIEFVKATLITLLVNIVKNNDLSNIILSYLLV